MNPESNSHDPANGAARMTALRSAVFHLASALVTLLFLPLYPVVLGPRRMLWTALGWYVGAQLALLRVICGLRFEVSGLHHLPDGPCILASRHEAMWETLFLPFVLGDPAVFLKQEILRYPLAGPIARRLGYIGVDRAGSVDSAKAAFDAARVEIRAGRSILIFPNGTRDPRHRYRLQRGVAVLYRAVRVPCVPVVLDSGDYWPWRSWLRRPGTIHVRILPPIPPGLPTDAFLASLGAAIRLPADPARPRIEEAALDAPAPAPARESPIGKSDARA